MRFVYFAKDTSLLLKFHRIVIDRLVEMSYNNRRINIITNTDRDVSEFQKG